MDLTQIGTSLLIAKNLLIVMGRKMQFVMLPVAHLAVTVNNQGLLAIIRTLIIWLCWFLNLVAVSKI